jgi:hypothetical protein
MATDDPPIAPPANDALSVDRLAIFNASIEAAQKERDAREAAERGELPRAAGPRAPRIFRWCDVPDYEGFQYRAHLNFPQRLLLDIQSGEEERARAALRAIIVEHNGWCDSDGEPYPPADAENFWEQIPTHLAVRVIRSLQAEIQDSPLAGRRRNA